jgi:pyruvate dehydrogenase E1 component
VTDEGASLQDDPAAIPVEVLDRIQRRVLWLAVSMIHHANRVRPNHSGVKVGGHQASSASMVSIMTALYLHHLRGADRVSVKPHASPVLHAINYLLGRLDRQRLTELRAFGGLQSYPSRTKDPDPVDFSTGSVGIGATATIWSAIARRYLATHFDVPGSGRSIALLGDAELDEGAIWEALVDPMVPELGELLWVVDLNRQSLDRVVPGIAAYRIHDMFAAAGWRVVVLKYGAILRRLFARPFGETLERRIDAMSNEEYQLLLRLPVHEVRDALAGHGPDAPRLLRVIDDLDDAGVAAAVRNLGGHDLDDLLHAFAGADRVRDRPTVILAYTIKAWGLPTEGHPGNHSALLSDEQWHDLAPRLGADAADPWAGFAPGSAEADACATAARRLVRPAHGAPVALRPPAELGVRHHGRESTQQGLGRFLLDLARLAPEIAERVVTVSPDVASSTNLGGWINRVGTWHMQEHGDWFERDRSTLLHWRTSKQGQHIELGIAEVSLVGLLAELGSTWSRDGQPLLPIGTLYDPFVARALEPWSFGLYSGGQSILVGTPSGVTLAPEGGAHQSVITPSIGLEQPGCTAWEPAFVQDLEWCLLSALGELGHTHGESAYFRLSTRPLDQSLAAVPEDPAEREARRRAVLCGAYLLRRAARRPDVCLAGMGAVMPDVIAAAEQLERDGIACDIVCVTSPGRVFQATRARRALSSAPCDALELAFPAERAAPIVSVLDGHPHTLAFLATIRAVPVTTLGVDGFGQAGDVADLYRYFGIDSATIAGAVFDLLEEAPRSER